MEVLKQIQKVGHSNGANLDFINKNKSSHFLNVNRNKIQHSYQNSYQNTTQNSARLDLPSINSPSKYQVLQTEPTARYKIKY